MDGVIGQSGKSREFRTVKRNQAPKESEILTGAHSGSGTGNWLTKQDWRAGMRGLTEMEPDPSPSALFSYRGNVRISLLEKMARMATSSPLVAMVDDQGVNISYHQ
jgi:hypothetical protein